MKRYLTVRKRNCQIGTQKDLIWKFHTLRSQMNAQLGTACGRWWLGCFTWLTLHCKRSWSTIARAMLAGRARFSGSLTQAAPRPWCTYCSPELSPIPVSSHADWPGGWSTPLCGEHVPKWMPPTECCQCWWLSSDEGTNWGRWVARDDASTRAVNRVLLRRVLSYLNQPSYIARGELARSRQLEQAWQ